MRKNMKLTRIFQNISIAVIITALGLTSCDYLDVVPPEQPNIDDAMSSPTRALGFLYSCYGGVSTDLPSAYLGEINSTTDEYVLPYSWNTDGYWGAYAFNTASSTNQDWLWGTTYQYIGQCYLFLQKLENAGSDIASDAEKEQWRAECQFLVAYYHFATLRRYGPIPITDSYIPMDTPTSEYNGRFHFDYCVDWIANQLDEAAKVLPANRTVTNEWGRATSTIAKAVKARLLLYAASPLWNGSFPYPNWQNENFETPGYGKALVSNTYDKSKWERALAACQEALTLATTSGDRELYDDDEYYSRQSLNLPFVPGVADVEDNKEFLKNVMKMRYAVSTRESEGNKEIIWGLSNQFDFYSRYPLRILKKSDGTWHAGYSGVSPTLYTFEHFYTANGKLPEKDLDFTPSSEWFESAGISSREDIIKLNVGREPRFYAWMAFDHCTQNTGYEIFSMNFSVTEITCHRQSVVYHRNSLCRAKRSARSLQFRLTVGSSTLTKFTEDSNDTANLLQSRLFSRELHYFLKTLYPSAHNIYFFINRIRQGKNDRIETALQGA